MYRLYLPRCECGRPISGCLKFRDTLIPVMQNAHISIGSLYYIHTTPDGFLYYILHTKFDDRGLQYI